jgi:transaldolase / glucose-6-phosphate isomerase
VLGINPFDQPNVQEAKDNTARVLKEGAEAPESELAPVFETSPPQYVAILGYVTPSDDFDSAIDHLRAKLRDRTKTTTTFGYGPRYLHSTGQYHKGGPPNGVFLQLYAPAEEDVDIPEAGFSFEHLKSAQALGDAQTLRAHGLPVVRIEVDGADAVRRLI